jgi:hypothetical protein
MSETNLKELRVAAGENAKRTMYIAKELLLNNETIEVVAGTAGAATAMKACETLARLKYVTYTDIRTETNIVNERRRTRVVIIVKKTSDFKRLYEENEANRKKFQEEKETRKGDDQN